VSDSVGIAGTGIWDLENEILGRGSIGLDLQHTPDLSTFIEYRTIAAEDSDLLEIGWEYRLSKKYRVQVVPQYDLQINEFRAAYMRLVREFPDFYFALTFGYDRIRDDTVVSASLRPVGF
jgi:hypothetical protein